MATFCRGISTLFVSQYNHSIGFFPFLHRNLIPTPIAHPKNTNPSAIAQGTLGIDRLDPKREAVDLGFGGMGAPLYLLQLGLEFLKLSDRQVSEFGDRLQREITFEAPKGDLHRYLFSSFPKDSGLFYFDIAH